MTSSIVFVLGKGHCSNSNNELFIAQYLFNAFLNFLTAFFIVYFSHSSHLGFTVEYGIS